MKKWIVLASLSGLLQAASCFAAMEEMGPVIQQYAPSLSPEAKNYVLKVLKCAESKIPNPRTITIIDYAKPSNEKRLWVLDVPDKKLLFHTHVAHGLNSGLKHSQYFSNQNNSKASSIGLYQTEKSYTGRHGLSLQLNGLDAGFNDNASNRAVVLHGGWYVEEAFISKYGRAGRSWGCPAVPDTLSEPLIQTIKEGTLFIIYYPDDRWLSKSKFLNCQAQAFPSKITPIKAPASSLNDDKTMRDDIIFADMNRNNRHDEHEPIAVVSADDYLLYLKHQVPLRRMLRRQMNNMEYVALNPSEFNQLESLENNIIHFVMPEIKMSHGYYGTEMKPVTINPTKTHLRTTHHFIRWIGL